MRAPSATWAGSAAFTAAAMDSGQAKRLSRLPPNPSVRVLEIGLMTECRR